jgi:hypothetical protein
MRSWKEWVPPWEKKKLRRKRAQAKARAKYAASGDQNSAAKQRCSGLKREHPARNVSGGKKNRVPFKDVDRPNQKQHVVSVGTLGGEFSTNMFPPLPRAQTASPPPPLRLQTRQAPFLKRSSAKHVVQRKSQLDDTLISSKDLAREDEDYGYNEKTGSYYTKTRPYENIYNKQNQYTIQSGRYGRAESLSRNHTTRFFESSRTVQTPAAAKEAGVYKAKKKMRIRQYNVPHSPVHHRQLNGSVDPLGRASFQSKTLNEYADKALKLPVSEETREQFDSQLEQYKVGLAERAVLGDRARSDYYRLYAQGKTMAQLETKARTLRKMFLYERFFAYWKRKHYRCKKAIKVHQRAHWHRVARVILNWKGFAKECATAKMKVALFGQSCFQRIKVVRETRMAKRIQKWWQVTCALRRLVLREDHGKKMDAFMQNAAEKMHSLRVCFVQLATFWYSRKMWRKKFQDRRLMFAKRYFQAFKVSMRTEISKRNHLKFHYRHSHGAFVVELRRAYTVRRRRVRGKKMLTVQCAARCWFARREYAKNKKWRAMLRDLMQRSAGRILAENWASAQYYFDGWTQYVLRSKRIKSFQKQLLFDRMRQSMGGVFTAWKQLHAVLQAEKLVAVRKIQRFIRRYQASKLREMIMLATKFNKKAEADGQRLLDEEAARNRSKAPTKQRFRLPTSQLYSPFLAKLTDALQDVKECEEPYFDTAILSTGQQYPQRFVMKTQRNYLVDMIERHIKEEKLRLRKRRRRSSTMWQTRLKEVSEGRPTPMGVGPLERGHW